MADLDTWELMISEHEADSSDTLQDTVKTNHLNSINFYWGTLIRAWG